MSNHGPNPPLNILLIASSEGFTQLLNRACPNSPHITIHHVRRSQRALDLLTEAPFLYNLIVLEIEMPEIGGFEVLEWLRCEDHHCRITPVIALSTSSNHLNVTRAYNLGAASYVQTPDNIEDLSTMWSILKTFWFNTAILPERRLNTLHQPVTQGWS